MADPFAQPNAPSALDFTLQVECFYAALISFAPLPQEPSLGGQLLYSGHLDPEARAILVAANIAGAASLAATADTAAQKQALRSGIVDFLVNSLDEALRILKNQVRKREPVAVCVALPPQQIEDEMLARGVLPPRRPPAGGRGGRRARGGRGRGAPPPPPPPAGLQSPFIPLGAHPIPLTPPNPTQLLLTWSASAAPALWLPKLDALAAQCLPPEAWPAHRWLRNSPRYLGRLAQGTRLLRCDPPTASKIQSLLQEKIASSQIPATTRLFQSPSQSDLNQEPSTQGKAHRSATP